MPHQPTIKVLLACLFLSIALCAAADSSELLESAWQHIAKKECDAARQLFDPPLDSPQEQCIYGKSVCCSGIDKLTIKDIDHALGYLSEASHKLGQDDEYMVRWIEDAKSQCHEASAILRDNTRLSQVAMITERQNKAEVWSRYEGKVTSRCRQDNLSPVLLPDDAEFDTSRWHYVVPRFGQRQDELAPSDEFLTSVLESYVGTEPEYAVCAPFIAVSSTQDPARICKAAHRFTDYFVLTYKARRPPVWISLYHYPQGGNQLIEHAERTTGPIRCSGVLGFFDWRRQSIVFKAPPNFFGTFRHELTHTLMYWDMPLAPRWLEEGIAAMYEHTNQDYQSLANPWRSRLLEKNDIDEITLALFTQQALSRSILEFESRPLGATLSREVMRKLQQCGDLPNLYGAFRKQYQSTEILEAYRAKPHKRPDEKLVTGWKDLIQQYADSPLSGEPCLQ